MAFMEVAGAMLKKGLDVEEQLEEAMMKVQLEAEHKAMLIVKEVVKGVEENKDAHHEESKKKTHFLVASFICVA